ncbi:MAG: hypothetical protein JWO86_1112 [Myxococcaceae bacterium]|jgi:hypothetical protein|nr:hypothetical protein [Myxococcaceae bacterium]MEA2749347.1 hypothetical protein [Myxococcales bacterium]
MTAPSTEAATVDEDDRGLTWLDHPTCEELAWLATLRRRSSSPDDPRDHALLDTPILKQR